MTVDMTNFGEVDPVIQGIMGNIAPIEDTDPTLRCLIYGDTGVYKTTWAAGAPDNLFVEADVGNLSALLNSYAVNQGQRQKRFQFRGIDQVEKLGYYASINHPALAPYKTITIDKLTDLGFDNLAEITNRQYGGGMDTRAMFKPQGDDYAENNERLRRIVANFRKSQKNLIVICHYRYFKNQRNVVTVGPDFSEKLIGNLSSMFNLVGYMTREDDGLGNTVGMMQTQPTPSIIAKCNIEGVPAQVPNSTWAQFYAAHTASLKRHAA